MSDEESAIFEPFLASLAEGGCPPKNHRKVLDGVFWMNRTGAPLARYTRGTGQLELGAQAVSQLVSLRRMGRAVAGVGGQRRAGMGGFRLCWTTAVSATQGICSRSSNGRNPSRPCENSSGESRRTPICVARVHLPECPVRSARRTSLDDRDGRNPGVRGLEAELRQSALRRHSLQSGEQPKSTLTRRAEPASEERNVTITECSGSRITWPGPPYSLWIIGRLQNTDRADASGR
jgi:hypothetical protein